MTESITTVLELPQQLKRYEVAPGICEIRKSKAKAIWYVSSFVLVTALFVGLYVGDRIYHFSFFTNHSVLPFIANGVLLAAQLEYLIKSFKILMNKEDVLVRLTSKSITDLTDGVARTFFWQNISEVRGGLLNKGKTTLEFDYKFNLSGDLNPIKQTTRLKHDISPMFISISRVNLLVLVSAYAHAYSPLMRDKL